MKLVMLTPEISVAPTAIIKIEVIEDRRGLYVLLSSGGSAIWVPSDYGKSAYQTKDALVARINEAMA
jgi:hypothetical protein